MDDIRGRTRFRLTSGNSVGYHNLQTCLPDLEENGHLIRFDQEVDPHLEAAEIQRRLYLASGPAIWFTNVRDCQFSMVSNLFGSMERVRFLFRDSLDAVRRLVELKIDPNAFWKSPSRYLGSPRTALTMLPRKKSNGPVLANITTVDKLPQLKSWPDDGGAFITLSAVYSESVGKPGPMNANLGMYRVQLSGDSYELNRQIGLHYQIHRGIGVQHAEAIAAGKPFRVNIFVGGAPAMSVAAVMPLPEGLSELTFAGALGRHRMPMIQRPDELAVYGEADFCIVGTVDPNIQLPEGPFGDHLGYYSLAHEFPVLNVEKVYHREGAIWPFTVVGRPPQEDTMFGELIHEITGPIIPSVIPGVHAVHAVDAAGVHPLMLAIGSERYVPYRPRTAPQELLTQGNAILGQGQMSLAKFLCIVAQEDDPSLDIHNIPAFFSHLLKRIDWRRDLHFQTRTTIDTLDYSGSGLNEGSKVVMAAVGEPIRELPTELPSDLRLPTQFSAPRIVQPGVLAVQAPETTAGDDLLRQFCAAIEPGEAINQFPLLILVDDSQFVAETLNNFLWVVFTRSNPAVDIDGVGAFTEQKHWGCRGSLVIDSRIKPHHAPPLIEDPQITAKVDALASQGGPLARYL